MPANAMRAGAAYIELQARASQLANDVRTHAESSAKKFSESFAKVAKIGLAAAGVAGMAAFSGALENLNATSKLKAQLALTEEDSKRLGGIAGGLYAKAYGDSLGNVNDAIKSLMQSGVTSLNAPKAEIENLTKTTLNLSKAFDVDVAESANAAGQMIKTGMAKDGKEALDVITVAFQKFGKNGDDVLDTLGEYNVQFQRLGIGGPVAMGLINQGLQAGARNTDVVIDALKEFTIEATQGSDKVAKGWKDLGLNSDKMFKAIGKGGKDAQDAFTLTLDKLRGVEDPIKRGAIAVELFGTKAEDMGNSLYALDPSKAVATLGEITGAADKMGDNLRDNPQVQIEQFKRKIETFLTGKATELIPYLTKAGEAFAGLPGPVQAGAVAFGGLALAAGPVSTVVKGVTTTVSGVATVTGGAWRGVMNLAAGFNNSQAAASAFTGTMGTVGGAIRTGVNAVGSGLATMGRGALNLATSAGTAAVNVAVSMGQMVVNATVTAAQFVAQMAIMAAQAVANMARVAWTFTVQAAEATAKFLVSMVQTVAATVVQFGIMAAEAIVWAATMAAQWIIAMGPIGWVTAVIVALVALVIANWDTVKKWTGEAWDWVANKVKAVAQFLVDVFMNFTLPGLIIKHWDTIKNATTSAWNAVVDFVRGIPGAIVNFFVNWTLVGVVLSHWDRIKSGVVNAAQGLVSYVSQIPGMIINCFSSLGSSMYNVGMNVVKGIWNGIQSMGAWLRDSLIGFAKNMIPGPIAKALGIHSPSRLMRDKIGKFIPAGVVEGVKLGAPALQKVMANLVPVPTMPGIASFADDWSAPVKDMARELPDLRMSPPTIDPPARTRVYQGAATAPQVTVNAQTNANPAEIGRELAWVLRTAGR
ncbi:phage tail tape measure protein [Kitasatospora sp. NPDC001132]